MKQGLGRRRNTVGIAAAFFFSEKKEALHKAGQVIFPILNILFHQTAEKHDEIRNFRILFSIKHFHAVLFSRTVADMFYRISAEMFLQIVKTFCGINDFFRSRTAKYRKLIFPQQPFGKSEECSDHFFRQSIIGYRFDYLICAGRKESAV